MFESIHISNRARNLIILGLSIFFLGLSAGSFYLTLPRLGKHYPGFTVMRDNLIPISYMYYWEGYDKGIKNGNVLVAVDGRPVTSAKQVYDLLAQKAPGAPVTYTFLKGVIKGGEFKVTTSVNVFTRQDYLFTVVNFFILTLLIYATGLILFYLKPNDISARLLSLFCFSMGIAYGAGPETALANGALYSLFILFAIISSVTLLFLGLNFPMRYKYPRFLGPLLLAIGLGIFAGAAYTFYFSDVISFRYFDLVFVVFMAGCSLSGISFITWSFIKAKDPVIRQKNKFVIIGFSGLGYMLFYMMLSPVFDYKFNPLILFPLGYVVILCLAYAVAKHNIFDADAAIRRGLGYLIVSGIVVVLFLGLAALLSLALQQVSGFSSQIAVVGSTLVLVTILKPLRDRVDGMVDRRFYRERYEYRRTIQKASEVLVSIIELDRLLRELTDTVLTAMKIEKGGIMLRQPDPDRFEAVIGKGYEKTALAPIPPDHPIVGILEARKRPIQINDVTDLDEFAPHRDTLQPLMKDLDLVLIIPIIFESRLIGLFGLSAKKSGAWYSTEDMELLQTLMNHTAVAIENARKVEDMKKLAALEKRQEAMQTRISRFLSPQLAQAMIAEEADPFAGTKRKKLTVFFSDIRGFTELSDALEPEETMDLLNHYLTEMTEIIYEFGGTLDKFMGDGIMVFFNDPMDQEDHAARAVRMAVAMQERMDRLQEQWFKSGQKPLAIGIGINTGYCTVGGIGSERRTDYTAIGNQVNLAARLQQLAKGGEIIVSHATYSQVSDHFAAEDRGEVSVKGLHQPIRIYHVRGGKTA